MNEIRCYEAKIKVGGHPTVVSQWHSTGSSSQKCPGLDSQRLPAFSLLSIFATIHCEARYSEHKALV